MVGSESPCPSAWPSLSASSAACQSTTVGTTQNYRDFLASHPPEDLTVTFFEVQNGDAFLFEFPDGGTMLVDAGDGRYVANIINYLEVRKIGTIDVALVTHPHWDHYGGMEAVLEDHPFGVFISNGRGNSMKSWAKLDAALTGRSIPRRVVRRGDTIDGFKDVTIDVLYPDAEAIAAAEEGDENHGSIVLRLTYGETVFLLVGDAEADEEARLIALEGEALRADVLKLGHHGSFGSGSKEWVAATQPKVAVCQGAGLANIPPFYPRPHPRLLSRLKKTKTRTYTPARDGAVQMVSNGKRIRVATFRDVLR